MSLAGKLRRAPLRLVTGAYIINSGVSKLSADQAGAEGVHGMAAGAYPVVKRVEPKVFNQLLAVGEIAVGAALLLPIVPAGLAGLALAGFGAALVGLYARTPGTHDRYYRPSQEGTGLAKDIFLVGIGAGLVVDAALAESPITNTD